MSPTPSLLLGLLAGITALALSGARLRRCLAALAVLALPAAAFEALGWRLGAGAVLPPGTVGFHVVNATLVLVAVLMALSARRLPRDRTAAPTSPAPPPLSLVLGACAWVGAVVVPSAHVPFALAAGALIVSTLRRRKGAVGLMAASADAVGAIGLLWSWWLVTTIAPGVSIAMLPEAPFSPAAEVLLGALVGAGALRLIGGWPLPLPAIGLVGAGAGAALVSRVVAEPMALAQAHWVPAWALVLALGALAAAVTRRPDRIVACLGGLGVVLLGTAWVPGWILVLAGMAWPWLWPHVTRAPLRALGTGVLTWAGMTTLAGTMQVETVYAVVTWLVATATLFLPARARPAAAG